MRRVFTGFVLLGLLMGLVVAVQGAMTRDQQVSAQVATEYLQELLHRIEFAQEVDIPTLIAEIKGPILIPEGLIKVGSEYAMYYEDHRPCMLMDGHGYASHTFGWYSEDVGCGALYPLVYGPRYKPCSLALDCSSPCSSPWTTSSVGWKIQIPDSFGTVGFWLNTPYSPTGTHIGAGGHYFTNPARNWDGLPHAFIWYFSLPPLTLDVTCDGIITTMTVNEAYVIPWEDECHYVSPDWNDFLVALLFYNH